MFLLSAEGLWPPGRYVFGQIRRVTGFSLSKYQGLNHPKKWSVGSPKKCSVISSSEKFSQKFNLPLFSQRKVLCPSKRIAPFRSVAALFLTEPAPFRQIITPYGASKYGHPLYHGSCTWDAPHNPLIYDLWPLWWQSSKFQLALLWWNKYFCTDHLPCRCVIHSHTRLPQDGEKAQTFVFLTILWTFEKPKNIAISFLISFCLIFTKFLSKFIRSEPRNACLLRRL